MTLKLYDTMARDKRPFEPADPSRVTFYVCGPTVYNHAHIGNFRAAVVFDMLYRLLRHQFGADAIIYARNFTDIDDKIIAAMRESGDDLRTITRRFADIYRDETAAFNVLTPDLEVWATDHIDAMTDLICALIDRGHAYAADGHVLFAVNSFDEYGALSGVEQDEIIAGARVDIAPYKKEPTDFVLWKPSAADEPGWDSPWGRGRPGWHLECSAMIAKTLGQTIDIHGGGQDLRFPHHENEIAQSRCAHDGAPLARYWVHNGFLRMGSDKMSKSAGNVVLPRDLLRDWPGEALRLALLSAHYRQPLDWTESLITQSKRQLDRFYRLLGELPVAQTGDQNADQKSAEPAPPPSIVLTLMDDMNTPEAIAGLHELRDIASQMDGAARLAAIRRLRAGGQLMGLFNEDPAQWFRRGEDADGLTAQRIDALLDERAAARKAKDFKRADEIRDGLAADGIVIEDGPNGATWRRE